MKQVKKRDGRIVDFDSSKIINAVLAAFKEVDGEISDYAKSKAQNIADYIEGYYIEDNDAYIPNIEDIQDLVEKGLMSSKRKDVAKAYVLYREERNKVRSANSKLIKTVKEKIEALDVQNQNANVDEHSFGGRMGEARNELLKDYALNYIVSDMARNNHLNNEIYIHDLDSYAVGMHNCLTVPFDMLLEKGFNTRQTDVRPANSVNTAFQLIAVIFQLQSLQQFGGVSASHLDWTMVPYVRKSFFKHWKDGQKYIEEDENADDLLFQPELSIEDQYYKNYPKVYQYALNKTIREAEQGAEGMYHNLNTLQSRSGNQLPFTSINYGTCTLPEGRIITKALLNGSLKGVGKLHKTPVFPCGIFQLMKGVNRAEGDPNYDLYQLALKSTAKRLYPNYVNVDWSTKAGYDKNDPKTYVSTMGCRTYNGADINAEPGTNPQTKDGRGNICPVTIIMPTLAMKVKNDANPVAGFMNLLDETRFFVLDQESSYDENVDRMARALTNQGELDAGFAQRVREREKYSTMVLDQNIAFPHTKNMLSKLTLAMGVFPDMLKDDKYGNIRIIILLGIPESMEDDTVLVRLYDDILSIGKKPDVIPKIQKMESYREFLLYIAEENNIFE